MLAILGSRALRRANRPGQSLVELAFVASILAIILLGIIELVGLFAARSYLQDASRAGVRLGALAYNDNSITSMVMNTLTQHGMNTLVNGQCSIQQIEIYQADPNGNPISGPNSEDVYPITPLLGVCTAGKASMLGWPPLARLVVVGPDQTPPSIGVRISYSYRLQTPIFRAFGTNFQMQYSSVLALGEDNANNFLALASSTPIPTYTSTNTPTATFTNTSTPTITQTPSVTQTFTQTPTFQGGTSPTWTATKTPTISPTPTITSTPTATPTATAPPLFNVQAKIPCDPSNHLISPPGVSISWTGSVPGAVSYEIHYVSGGVDNLVATISPTYNQYPIGPPPYEPALVTGAYWYVKATLPSGSYSNSQTVTVDAAHACQLSS